jgi:CheY-like chemotaxis protein
MTARILIVDDEDGIRSVLADTLDGAGHATEQATDARAALDRLEDEPFDVMLSDLRMPGDLDGMDLVRRARARWPEMQIIVLTAHGSIDMAVEAIGRLRNLLWQLKRRRVYSVAVGYVAIGFLSLQAAELILPAVPHPDWLYTALVGLTLAGFPVAVLLGWVFDVTAKGIRRTDA